MAADVEKLRRSQEAAETAEPATGVPDAFSEKVAETASETDEQVQAEKAKDGAVQLVQAAVDENGQSPEQLSQDLESDKKKADSGDAQELPDNKFSQALKMLKDEVDANPSLRGPLVNAAMSFLALAAKYCGFADMLPGGFLARLESDEDLKEKKFEEDELAAVLKMDKAETNSKESDVSIELAKTEYGVERASTRYVSQSLWGLGDIEDASQLAAKLRHTRKAAEGKNIAYYATVGLEDLKKDGMPFGTVLIFAKSIRSPEKTVAYATGNGDEFKYYDAEQKKVIVSRLKDEKSPIRSRLGLLAAFRPKFNSDPDYFQGEREQQLDSRVDDTPFGMPRRLKSTVEGTKKLVGSYLLLARKANVEGRKKDAEELAKDARRHLDPCIQTVEPLFEKVLADTAILKDPAVVKMMDEASEAYESAVSDALDYYSKNITKGNPEKKLADHAKTAHVHRQRVQALLI